MPPTPPPPTDVRTPAPPEATWVDTADALAALAVEVRGRARIAIDTEANSLHAYREQVCIIQLTAGDTSWIVDPLAIGDLEPLAAALDRDDIEVIVHGGDFDVAVLTRDHDFRFHRMFDTMIAATMLGDERLGLAHLVEDTFGEQLDKRYQRADWAHRPLGPDELRYLVDDTRFLPVLRDLLHSRLVAAGVLEEAQIEFARLARRCGKPIEYDPEGWRRIKGAGSLPPLAQAILRALYEWREAEAERRDVPPFKVLAPRALLTLARRPPRRDTRPRDLRALPGPLRRRLGRAVLEAVAKGREAIERGDLPRRPHRPAPPRHGYRNRVAALRAWRKAEAERRGVPPIVVLPNPAIDSLAQTPPDSVEDLASNSDIGPKRAGLYGEQLLRLAGGRTSAGHSDTK